MAPSHLRVSVPAASLTVARISSCEGIQLTHASLCAGPPFLRPAPRAPPSLSPCCLSPPIGAIEGGFRVGDFGSIGGTTYESNVIYALRFMIDLNVVGGNWIELPAGTYVVPQSGQTYCQIEAHVRYDSIISHPPEGVDGMEPRPLMPPCPEPHPTLVRTGQVTGPVLPP